MTDGHNWEADHRPLADCLKDWHGRHRWGREAAAHELRTPVSTYNGWCAGRPCAQEGAIRRLMTLIDRTDG